MTSDDFPGDLPPEVVKKMQEMGERVGDILGTMRAVKGEEYTTTVVQMARAAQVMDLLRRLKEHTLQHAGKNPPDCLVAEFGVFASVVAEAMSASLAQYVVKVNLTESQIETCHQDADTLFNQTRPIKV